MYNNHEAKELVAHDHFVAKRYKRYERYSQDSLASGSFTLKTESYVAVVTSEYSDKVALYERPRYWVPKSHAYDSGWAIVKTIASIFTLFLGFGLGFGMNPLFFAFLMVPLVLMGRRMAGAASLKLLKSSKPVLYRASSDNWSSFGLARNPHGYLFLQELEGKPLPGDRKQLLANLEEGGEDFRSLAESAQTVRTLSQEVKLPALAAAAESLLQVDYSSLSYGERRDLQQEVCALKGEALALKQEQAALEEEVTRPQREADLLERQLRLAEAKEALAAARAGAAEAREALQQEAEAVAGARESLAERRTFSLEK